MTPSAVKYWPTMLFLFSESEGGQAIWEHDQEWWDQMQLPLFL